MAFERAHSQPKLTLLLWGLVALLVTLPGTASSQEEGADTHYATAMGLVNEGRYREAVDELNKAIAASPESIFYCNRGVIRIRLEEFNDAIKDLKSCRDTFKGDREERAQIDAQYQGVLISHKQTSTTARNVAQRIALGRATPKVTKPPKVEERVVVSQDDSWGAQEYGLLSLTVGAALLGSALTVDLLSAQTKETLIEASKTGTRAEYEEAKSTVETRQTAFYTLGAIGGVATVLGISLIVVDLTSDDSPASSVRVGTGGQDVWVKWSF